MVSDNGTLMIVDGHALMFRAYYALPETLVTTKGDPINATFGFTSMLMKALIDIKPTHIVIAFDSGGRVFRHSRYPLYKSTRKKDQITTIWQQFPHIRAIVEALGFPIIECQNYEGDDILGTIANQATNSGIKTILLSGDLDTLQLVTNQVYAYVFRKGVSDLDRFDATAVYNKLGVTPEQIPDYKGLVGDSSDAIPGVSGIGAKTAVELLTKYNSLDNLYAHLQELRPKVAEKLQKSKEDAYLSKWLGTIECSAPVTLNLSNAQVGHFNNIRLLELFTYLEFQSLLGKLGQILGQLPTNNQQDPTNPIGMVQIMPIPQLVIAPDPRRVLHHVDIATTNTTIVLDILTFKTLIQYLKASNGIALHVETTSDNMQTADLIGLSFSIEEGFAWYIPVNNQLSINIIFKELQSVFENPKIVKYLYNAKLVLLLLSKYQVQLQGIALDIMLGSYLLNPGIEKIEFNKIVQNRFQIQLPDRDRTLFDQVATFAGATVDMILRLVPYITHDLYKWHLMELYQQIEQPIVPILVEMEQNGIGINISFLQSYKQSLIQQIEGLEQQIYTLAGKSFNLASTRQLSQILFKDLKLPFTTRNKSGHTVAENALLPLKNTHPIISLILEHRQLVLIMTDIDRLLQYSQTGRIYTHFNQTVTTTGRFSSSGPNLQDIPIKSDIGKLLRRAFIAKPGYQLLSIDYSQIELRILAHITHDKEYVEVFNTGGDIYKTTASRLFEVPISEVTPKQRNIAKTVTLAILYGQTSSGLAQYSGMTKLEASLFIERYHQTYTTIQKYIQSIVRQLNRQSYVNTFFGRKRFFPDFSNSSNNDHHKQEREAWNMPIQGGNADILKLAIIGVSQMLKEQKSQTKIVLQVHDELLFEIPNDELDSIPFLIQERMQNIVQLDVPIKAEMRIGPNWLDTMPL